MFFIQSTTPQNAAYLSESQYMLFEDITKIDNIVVCWINISPEKPIAIFITHSRLNCGDELRETTGIVEMPNECILWHIGNDYHFT